MVPLVATPVRRERGWKQHRLELRALGVHPYDARRGFEHLLEESGIRKEFRQLYMGHALDTTENYGRADIAAFLVEHAALIRGTLQAVEKTITAARRKAMKLA